MEFDLEKKGTTACFTFNNAKLEYSVIRNMEKQMIKEFENCDKIVFNMKNTDFIASAFIRLCLEAIQRVGKENFEIINAKDFVHTVLQISKIDNFIKVST